MDTMEVLQALRAIGIQDLIANGDLNPRLEKQYSEALTEAIKALENQPKYEAALKLMADDHIINCTRQCPLYGKCSYQGLQNCMDKISGYYKKQAGLEDD